MKRNSIPCDAPGSVTERTATTNTITSRTGIITFVYLSMPSLMPAITINAVAIRKMSMNTSGSVLEVTVWANIPSRSAVSAVVNLKVTAFHK